MNSQWDAVYVTIAGQQFPLPYTAPSFSTVLNISTAGNYSVGIWLESPKLGPRQWLGSYLVTVYVGPPSPAAAEVRLQHLQERHNTFQGPKRSN